MRIVVRADDPRRAREAQAALAAAGVEAAAMPGPYRAAPDGEDITIIASPNGMDDAALAIAAGARAAPLPPIAVLAAVPVSAPPPLGLEGLTHFDGAVTLDAPEKLLAAQVTDAVRVALAEDERARRARTVAALETPLPQSLEARKLKALYIGAPSPIFLALERALSEHGGLVGAAFSSFAGFDHLHDEPFDAVVLNGAQDSATALSLCAALRRNASLYHLPTMMVIAPGDTATAATAITRGAVAITASTAPCGQSMGWLFEAIRRERRRRAAEHDLWAMRDVMGDARTGLFKRHAFDDHLARLAAEHHVTGRQLALSLLHVMPAHGSREPSEQAWKRGFGEIASLASRLMRDTDSGCTLGGRLIAIALPATSLTGAKRTGERVASVAECTAFASGEGDVGPLVFEQSAVELQPGESGAALLNRAMAALDLKSATA